MFYFYILSLELYFMSMSVFCFMYLDYAITDTHLESQYDVSGTSFWKIKPYYYTQNATESDIARA